MSPHWPFWLGGLFLAGLPIIHWLLLRHMFAVSSRYTAVTDWLRGRTRQAPEAPMDEAALLAALERETASAFGAEAVTTEPIAAPTLVGSAAPSASGLRPHLAFLGSVILGGAASTWWSTGARATPHGPSGLFVAYFGTNPIVEALIFVVGGICVGFGTRMAGGCTSGHGLCGTSRLQPGSLVSTACFFGIAIVVSFAMKLTLGGGL